MPLIQLSKEDDGLLEQVAPPYLKGSRGLTARRVSWGISKLVKLLGAGADTANAESPDVIPAPQN